MTATVKVMIVMPGKIGGELVEITLRNRFCDPEEFFPNRRMPPPSSAGSTPYLAWTRVASISFPGWCHVAIIAKRT